MKTIEQQNIETMFLTYEEDPIAALLQTGFMEFTTREGVSGLCKVLDNQLHVLAIISSAQGQGQLRSFVARAKTVFDQIFFMSVWSGVLQEALIRYGFEPAIQIDTDGSPEDGLLWRKNDHPKTEVQMPLLPGQAV